MGLPRLVEGRLDDRRRLALARRHVAGGEALMGDEVRSETLVDERRGRLQRRLHLRDGFERIVLDEHQARRILRAIPVGRDDAGDGIALKADLLDREGRHLDR
jgi:hypothetical protein